MKFLKNNLKLIIGLIVGAILAGGIVYAATSASQVTYTTNKNAQVQTVADALNDLYENRKEIKTLETEFGPFEMGSRSGYWNYTPVKLKGLDNYSLLTIQLNGNIGTYISARIYVDDILVITIEDTLEHEIQLNNNDELQVNFYCYNGLNNGTAGVKVKAE